MADQQNDDQTTDSYKYWAFVSYSSKDRKWGEWLHKRLENYPIPGSLRGRTLFDGSPLGKNLRPCFIDREVLTGAAELGPAILEGLKQSRYLIVLCSPHSAQSTWVNKEVLDFRRLGGEKRILTLILDGEPNATSNPRLDDSLECFPKALRYPLEPLAGDLRESGDGKERGFLKVLAGAAELSFPELYNRHRRVQRKKLISIATISAAILLILSGLAIFALNQKNAKDRAIAEARQNARARYEAEVSKTAVALQDGSTISALRALASSPTEHRGWEWNYLAKLAGPAPLKINPSDIAILDQGPLAGSGLLEDAQKLLEGDGFLYRGGRNKEMNANIISGGRGGGTFSFSRSPDDTVIQEFTTHSYGSPHLARFSSDGTCLLLISDPLRAAALAPAESSPVGDTVLYIFPVPHHSAYVSTMGHSRLALMGFGAGILAEGGMNQVLSLRRKGEQLEIENTPSPDHLLDDGYYFGAFLTALDQPAREQIIDQLYSYPDNLHGENPSHAIIDYRLHRGKPQILAYTNEQLYLYEPPASDPARRLILPAASKSYWNSHLKMKNSFTVGAASQAKTLSCFAPTLTIRPLSFLWMERIPNLHLREELPMQLTTRPVRDIALGNSARTLVTQEPSFMTHPVLTIWPKSARRPPARLSGRTILETPPTSTGAPTVHSSPATKPTTRKSGFQKRPEAPPSPVFRFRVFLMAL